MFLIHGSYHWWPKRVGFRNDYCVWCEAPRRAIATRTFDVGHVFWVPLVPVGFWKHWACTACRRDPHRSSKARRPFKWIGLLCLLILSAMFWMTPIDKSVFILGWALRLAPLGGALALLYQLISSAGEPTLKEHLASIPAAADTMCPFCATPLMAGDRWSCPSCGVERY